MYSLTNVATVVRDLARHPRAGLLAGDLLLALTLTRDDLELLDEVEYAAVDRARRSALVAAAARAPVIAGGASFGVPESIGNVTIGDLGELVGFVRDDVLAEAWQRAGDVAICLAPTALDVVSDGVVSTYAGDRTLGSGWRRWSAVAGGRPPESVAPRTLDVVRAMRFDAPPRVPRSWAELMHDACWAISLTGRERTAAAAQLHSLRALVDTVGPQPRHALVAAVVASTHAEVVADVLPSDTVAAMTRPLRELVG